MSTISLILLIPLFTFCAKNFRKEAVKSNYADIEKENVTSQNQSLAQNETIKSISSALSERLIIATLQGNSNEVRALLKNKNLNINYRNSDGDAAIHYATGFISADDFGNEIPVANIGIVKLLVQNKADINISNRRGDSPLLNASIFCQYEIAKFLIDNGANIKLKNSQDDTVLHYAVHCPIRMSRLLLDKNANLNERNLGGKTPLDLAKENENKQVISYLISKGAK